MGAAFPARLTLPVRHLPARALQWQAGLGSAERLDLSSSTGLVEGRTRLISPHGNALSWPVQRPALPDYSKITNFEQGTPNVEVLTSGS